MAFLGAPEYEVDHPNLLRKIIRVLKGVMQGKTNNTGSFTLTANSATTTVTFADGQLGQGTVMGIFPKSAHAAAEQIYESSRSVANNTITFTHANAATTDRTFDYILVG